MRSEPWSPREVFFGPSELNWLGSAIEHDDALKALWETGANGGTDPAANDRALCIALAERGKTDREIATLIDAYPRGVIGCENRGDAYDQLRMKGLLHVAMVTREMAREFAGTTVPNSEEPSSPERAAEPLFDLELSRFGRFFLTEPPEREFIIEGILPLGITGILASQGGGGKSSLVYQLGFSVTTGVSFLGMTMGPPGGFLYLAGEDDEGELHRRGLALLKHFERMGHTVDREMLSDRLHVVSPVSADNLLTRTHGDGEVHRTALVDRLSESASRIPDLRMIVIDPVSRFRGGRANYEEDATRFVEALETIREATGATVLALSHVSQVGMTKGGGQEVVRGSTALVDGVRFVATLRPLRRDDAKNFGVKPDEASLYVRLEIPKSNYTPPFPGLWLKRQAGGIMVPTELEERAESGARMRKETEYQEILSRVQELLRTEGPLTATRIEKDFAGQLGVLQAGEKKVRDVLTRAGRDGSLVKEANPGMGGGYLLHLPEAPS